MEAPPPPPPSTSTKTKKKWAVQLQKPVNLNEWKLDLNWTFSVHDAQSAQIEEVKWENAVGVKCSSEGTAGVFFVDIKDEGALVLKGSSTVAADLFTSLLAARVGVKVPKFRVVSYLSKEWDPMVQILWKLENTNSQEGRGSKLSKCLLRPFLIIMELIKGFDLEQLPKENAKAILSDVEALKNIGKLVAFDMVINNWDRLPFIWKNEGNGKNLLIDTSSKTVYGIDSTITSIDPELYSNNFNTYRDSVVRAYTAIKTNPEKESSETKRLRNFILLNTTFDIGDEGSAAIQQGALEGMASLISIEQREFDAFKQQVHEQLQSTMQMLGLDEETVGLNRINTKFLFELVSHLKGVV